MQMGPASVGHGSDMQAPSELSFHNMDPITTQQGQQMTPQGQQMTAQGQDQLAWFDTDL